MTAEFASARARDLAAELGLRADAITSTGRTGAVTIADVRAARESPRAAGFAAAGARLWREVTAGLELRPDELAILAAAARTADQIAALEQTVAASPPMIPGSKDQDVLHPAIPELRLQRQLLSTLLAKIDVPEHEGVGGEWDGLTASSRARKAAAVRWGRRA